MAGLAKLELAQIDLKTPELSPEATEEQRQAADRLGHLEATISVQYRATGNAIRSEKEKEQALEPVEQSIEQNPGSNSLGDAACVPKHAGEQPFKNDVSIVEQQPLDGKGAVEGPSLFSEHNVSNGSGLQSWGGVDGKTVLIGVWRALANRVVEAVAAQPGRSRSSLGSPSFPLGFRYTYSESRQTAVSHSSTLTLH